MIRWSWHVNGRETSCHPRWAPRNSSQVRRSGRPPDEPEEALLEEARNHEARSHSVLRRYLAVAAAASSRSGDGDEALPQRSGRRFLLYEARSRTAARL